jgi:hypothetical protein
MLVTDPFLFLPSLGTKVGLPCPFSFPLPPLSFPFQNKNRQKTPPKQTNKKNRALVYVFAHVLEGKIKKKITRIVRESCSAWSTRVYYCEQHSIKCGPMSRE